MYDRNSRMLRKITRNCVSLSPKRCKNHEVLSKVSCANPPKGKAICEKGDCTSDQCYVEDVGHFTGLKTPNKSGSEAHAEGNQFIEIPDPLYKDYSNKQAMVVYDIPKNSNLDNITSKIISKENEKIISTILNTNRARLDFEEKNKISTSTPNTNNDV